MKCNIFAFFTLYRVKGFFKPGQAPPPGETGEAAQARGQAGIVIMREGFGMSQLGRAKKSRLPHAAKEEAVDEITRQNDDILRKALTRYCEEELELPTQAQLDAVTFTADYERHKQEILRAGGRPVQEETTPYVRVAHARGLRRALRVGVVAALIAVTLVSTVFSDPTSTQIMAGFELDVDAHFATMSPEVDENGFLAPQPDHVYLELGDGRYTLPYHYKLTYVTEGYELEEARNELCGYYLYRKGDGFLWWSGPHITFYYDYLGSGTSMFNLDDGTLLEIDVEGVGPCLYYVVDRSQFKDLVWTDGRYIFQLGVGKLPVEELIKMAQSVRPVE